MMTLNQNSSFCISNSFILYKFQVKYGQSTATSFKIVDSSSKSSYPLEKMDQFESLDRQKGGSEGNGSQSFSCT